MKEKDSKYLNHKLDKLLKKKALQEKKVILFGATLASKEIRDYLVSRGVNIYAIIENSKKVDSYTLGILVHKPEDLLDPFDKDVVVLVYSQYWNEMSNQLIKMGYKNNKNFYVLSREKTVNHDSLFYFILFSLYSIYGFTIYKSLRNKYGNRKILVCPYTGIGDAYLIGAYLSQYVEKEGISEYVLVVVNKGCCKVFSIFNEKYVEQLTQDSVGHIIKAYLTFGSDLIDITILNDSWATVYTSSLRRLRGYKNINFADMFQHCVFNLPEAAKPKLPQIHYREEYIQQFFNDNNLEVGRTVILSPYANTLTDIPKFAWEQMASLLSNKGYVVCTNSSSDKEPAIKNTKGIFFGLQDAAAIIERAGYFIGVRSGFCDVISQANCKKIVLYAKNMSFGAGSVLEYFSMEGMGLTDNVYELEYEEMAEGYNSMVKTVIDNIAG